jgi:uncharacterized circularly permuted ATP-grasp superfamily protein
MSHDATGADAIGAYHDLLTDELAAESQAHLDAQQRARGLFFGERPLCTVLRPRFLSPDQYRHCQQRGAVILAAFAKAHAAALADPGLRAQFGLWDWEESLVGVDRRFRDSSPTGRLDAFFERGSATPRGSGYGLRFTEYNAETPAGAGYSEVLGELFDGLPVMRDFTRRYDLRPFHTRAATMRVLLDAYAEWSGTREAPRIAILDWREVPTYAEFVIFERYFSAQGLECAIADPREVEYRDGRLMAGDFHVSLIYKRVLISELVERCGIDGAVVRAVRDGAVCMVNPFACKILHKKASLAVLSDERNAALFTAEERAAIAEHIPWTRRVEERRTEFRGGTIDLLPYVRDHRDQFVLKPNDEYGGKGILLGWQVDAEAWEKGLREGLTEPYIVQERIALPSEAYPSLVEGRLRVSERMFDTAPFTFHGAYVDGCLTRIATDPLLNVTAGGGSTVPTYVVEKR